MISFVVMLGIGLIEAIGLGLGHLDLGSGMHADGTSHAPGLTLLDWLGLGDIPILIWLTSLLACFTVLGIAIQQIAAASLGAPLSSSNRSASPISTRPLRALQRE